MDMKKNLIIDVAALVVYLVVANPAWTGIAMHEWISLGLFVVFLVHMALHFDWVMETARTAFRAPSWARTGSFILNILIVLVFIVCMVSGVLVSGAVLPTFGFYAPGYYFWDPLHAMSAKGLLALLLVHVVIHWKWFMSFITGRKGTQDDNNQAG